MSTQTEQNKKTVIRRPGFSFFDWLGSLGTEDIGIDLGTSNVVVYVKKKRLVYPESSAVAVRVRTGEMFAYGTRAEAMEGRTPQSIRIVHPLRDSAIVDYGATAYLLNSIINHSYLKSMLFHPRMIVCVPAGVSGVQRRAILEAAVTMGVRKAVLIDQPIAALIGMGVDTERMQGAMVVDIGGGSVNVSVVSRHGMVVSDSTYEGGLAMDQAIMTRVREKYKVQIGRPAAESLKKQLGILWDMSGVLQAGEAAGKSLESGLPVKIGVTGEDVSNALRPIMQVIYKKVLGVLQKTPPALLADIRDHGIMLSGGGAQLWGLDAMITKVTGIPAYVVEQPMYVNAIGAGAALDYMDYMRDSLQDLH